MQFSQVPLDGPNTLTNTDKNCFLVCETGLKKLERKTVSVWGLKHVSLTNAPFMLHAKMRTHVRTPCLYVEQTECYESIHNYVTLFQIIYRL